MRLLGNVRNVVTAFAVMSAVGTVFAAQSAEKYHPPVADLEVSLDEPMPPGFGIQRTDVDGPVFTDARGMTVYSWPFRNLDFGPAGDRKGTPSKCTDVKQTETTGFMGIFTAGLILPDLDIRPSCTQAWPPVFAEPDAKPVGNWTISERPDGRKQWAYDGFPLYTSSLDTKPGQVNGAMRRRVTDGDPPAVRMPMGPDAAMPPAFEVATVTTGRIIKTSFGLVVYTSDADRPNISNCKADCLKEWLPVVAAEAARPQGEWGVIERAPGVKQWTFRTKPVYTYAYDKKRTSAGTVGTSLIGNDVSGWRPAYTQRWPEPPREFTVQNASMGQVLADKNGKTLYFYQCGDDASDQLECDHPSQTQVYRLAICGRFDPDLCGKMFPYVPAPKDAKVDSLIWGTAWIDPKTGHYAKPDAPGALHVWTFRDKPIFTHGRDEAPGVVRGDGWGEHSGYRNGYKAIWLRDDFNGNAA